MDIELRNFQHKIKSIPKVRGLVWGVVFVLKMLLHYVTRKVFKKSNRSFALAQLQKVEVEISIQQLNFLQGSLRDNFSYKNFSSYSPHWHRPFSDEQDLHLLHRLRDLPFFVNDSSRLGSFVELIQSWSTENSEGTLPGWHPYTLSERLVALSWVLNEVSQRNTAAFQELKSLLTTMCIRQASFLRHNFEFALGHHNHLINNARALLTVSTLLTSIQDAAEWRKFALKVFMREWQYQILPDGVHAEQSVTYHFLLTRTLWEIKHLMEQNGEQFPFDEDLTKMIRYARVITRPDGTIPFLGHLTPDWHWKELVGLLPVWGEAIVSLSDLGKLYKKQLDSNDQTVLNHAGIFLYPNAGQGILRVANVHAVLSCDPRGEVAIHGDQNYLGLDVWFAGTHLIRDAGLASYNLDARRSWYESWQGQSTFCIDGLDPMVSNWRKRQLPKGYHKANSTLMCDPEKLLLEAVHTGYCRLPDPVVAERHISIQGDSDFCIEDRLHCKARHTYVAKFHFGYNTIKQLSEQSIQINDLNNGNTFELHWSADLELTLEESPFAIAYGEESIGITGSFKCIFTTNTKIEYLLKRV